MKRIQLRAWTLVALICSAGPGPAEQTNGVAPEYRKSAGPCAVDILRYDWVDPKRDRKVPVKIYFPKTGEGPFPVVVFSHGLGGSREGYEYLGRHWASHGYVSVHVQHLGSDNAVWENTAPDKIMGKMRSSAANLQNAINRPKDVTFVIDQLEKINREESPLKKRLDLERIGVAGHSFGAFTTLAIAGETFPGAMKASLADPRVKAVIAMSAPVPSAKARLDDAFRSIKIPCLHMTGTKDYSPIGETKPEDRRLPFDHINGPDQFLIIFKDGDHMIFSGRGRMSGGQKDELFQAYIRMSSIAFWDAYLKNDAKAKAWLTGGDFKKTLDQDGTFEMKLH
jgi:predicted dienelactone hydrolase